MGKFLWWRELRADGPPGADASRDSGRVPLSPQKNAKGGERGDTTRLRLEQVSPALQHIFLGAKRKPAPSTQARPCPEARRHCVVVGARRRERKVSEGEKVLAKARRYGALWAPRHREIVGGDGGYNGLQVSGLCGMIWWGFFRRYSWTY